MTTISIAMATYNGERFIAEQLDSLAAQSRPPHELVVCDDGSSDATLEIVESFARRAPFPVRVFRNERNLGYADNFLKAAGLCEGDWVAFCDQDDVWLPHKLADCAQAIARSPEAVMVLQNAELCDEQLRPQGRLFPARAAPGRYGPLRQPGFWVWPGFVKTVTRRMFDRLDVERRPANYFGDQPAQSHDKWTCMVANALGGVVVLGGAAALYRRHAEALTGTYAQKPLGARVRRARGVGAEQYDFAAEVAASSAAYLRRMASAPAVLDWAPRLAAAAEAFERLARTQARRGELYRAGGPAGRLRRHLGLWLSGGYLGPRFSAMGLRSAAKDAAYAVLGEAAL